MLHVRSWILNPCARHRGFLKEVEIVESENAIRIQWGSLGLSRDGFEIGGAIEVGVKIKGAADGTSLIRTPDLDGFQGDTIL